MSDKVMKTDVQKTKNLQFKSWNNMTILTTVKTMSFYVDTTLKCKNDILARCFGRRVSAGFKIFKLFNYFFR